MEQNKLDRINELARKSKACELTPEEKAEQKALREEYICDFRACMTNTLDNTYLKRPDGTMEKLSRKD